ncbi:MAG: SOS response-associated peptidase [Pseudomonadota bacterium]
MCGRFNITSDPLSRLLAEMVGMPYDGQDNFNLAPTEMVPVLRVGADGTAELVPMRWWLTPFWARELTTKYSMFNAKSETAHKSPAFKEPYRKRRCVVPVTGYYEWCREQQRKVPYFITPEHTDGLLLAGLWDSWKNKQSDEELLSFTVLTTAANNRLGFVHHRQPVMLSVEEARAWLDHSVSTDDLAHLFDAHLPMDLEAVPVSTHVNNARHKDDRCMQPIAPAKPIAADQQETRL